MHLLIAVVALLVYGLPACGQVTTPSITVDASSPLATVNPLLFGHNVTCSGNAHGMWNTKFNDLDPGAASFVKSLSPTLVRFPGGSFSDLYMWEDGIGYQTASTVTPTTSSLVLDTVPQWGTMRKARFIDSMGGQFGDLFSFVRLTVNQLEGVSGLRATHPAGAEVRPEARAGQSQWTSHSYGTDEHLKFVSSLNAQTILTVNYATGLDQAGAVTTAASLSQRVKRAAAWVAYLNGSPTDERPLGVDAEGRDWHTVGYWAQKRVARGHPAPYGVRYWEIGNEVYGRWEAGYTTARQYANDFIAFATAMKTVDPAIEVGAVGRAEPHQRGDADLNDEWNATVVQIAGDYSDFLILHPYYPATRWDPAFYASSSWFSAVMAGAQQAMSDLKAVRDVINTHSRRSSEIRIAITEYGINPNDYSDPRVVATLTGALNQADLLMSFIKADPSIGLQIATAFVLHQAGPLGHIGYDWATGARVLRPSYYAFQLVKASLKPQQLRVTVSGPSFSTGLVGNVKPNPAVPLLEALATVDVSSGKLSLLVLNRSLSETISVLIRFNQFLPAVTAQVHTLQGPTIGAHNEDVPTTVRVVTSILSPASASFTHAFPPHSLTSIEFSSASARAHP
jgi:alpha-N-arabinofuranosidase